MNDPQNGKTKFDETVRRLLKTPPAPKTTQKLGKSQDAKSDKEKPAK